MSKSAVRYPASRTPRTIVRTPTLAVSRSPAASERASIHPRPLYPERMSGRCPDGVDTCDVGLRDDMQDAVGLAHGASGDPAWCNFTRLFAVREHKIADRQELDLRDAVGAHRRSLVIRPSTSSQRTAKRHPGRPAPGRLSTSMSSTRPHRIASAAGVPRSTRRPSLQAPARAAGRVSSRCISTPARRAGAGRRHRAGTGSGPACLALAGAARGRARPRRGGTHGGLRRRARRPAKIRCRATCVAAAPRHHLAGLPTFMNGTGAPA